MENTGNVQTALANDDRIDLGRFEWTREPAECEIKGDTIAVTTKPHTDLWQRTYYHFRNDNAPVRRRTRPSRLFSQT